MLYFRKRIDPDELVALSELVDQVNFLAWREFGPAELIVRAIDGAPAGDGCYEATISVDRVGPREAISAELFDFNMVDFGEQVETRDSVHNTSISADRLFRCNGGPLRNEWHCQGPVFEFPGGHYRLVGAAPHQEYLWEPEETEGESPPTGPIDG